MTQETSSSPKALSTRWKPDFVDVADGLKPTIHRWDRKAFRVVCFEPDGNTYFGVRSVPITTDMEAFGRQLWGTGTEFILDFGIHMVGYLSMRLDAHLAHMDAPCRLRFTFGESPLDVTMGMDGVKTWISTSWLPDEVVNVDECPATMEIQRRHAFRYVRVEILATSAKYKVSFSDCTCECVSVVAPSQELELPQFKTDAIRAIDHASISTLRDCMQAVFEDGPRRDRRLWLGDLRLQALTNYCTFKDYNLVKRCIFQFAAVPREDGSVPACIFDTPKLEPSTDYIVDYDALFAVVVDDYVAASGDLSAGAELWPTVLGCLRRPLSHLCPETGAFDSSRGQGFKFLDWQKDLHRDAGCHGLLLYCLKAANNLARRLQIAPPFEMEVSMMTRAGHLFMSPDGEFISGPDAQRSFASAAWLTLSGAFEIDIARSALLKTFSRPDAVRPLTPYLWHYVCDALAAVGLYDKCEDLIMEYWGGMLKNGADTFWEAYDPVDSRASPYGDVRNNSFCHAWSCTPAYFLRGKLRNQVTVASTEPLRKTTMDELDQVWISGFDCRYAFEHGQEVE